MDKLICPKCFSTDANGNKYTVTCVNGSHYICDNPNCKNDEGNRVEFQIVEDDKIYFPDNQIFVTREKEKFYRKPYLQVKRSTR